MFQHEVTRLCIDPRRKSGQASDIFQLLDRFFALLQGIAAGLHTLVINLLRIFLTLSAPQARDIDQASFLDHFRCEEVPAGEIRGVLSLRTTRPLCWQPKTRLPSRRWF